MPARVQALLFDLGGVLIDIDFDLAFRHWQAITPLPFEEIRRTFRFDDPYRRHERGEISAPAYFDHLRAVLQLQGSDEQILAGWNSIYIREIRETTDLIRTAAATLPCHVFTNTNAVHQAAWASRFPAAMEPFTRIFASHEIGMRKPEKRAFDHIAATLGVPPGAILFFDDLAENVEGAVAAGLRAVQVRRPEDVRDALRLEGMIAR